ncbi:MULTISPECIES: amino acid ABC transporter permease [Rhizobium]|uniref:Amino acid ABC transporter permease n=1 Tax=Rhizobium tropici TaxID=398 RepID=A0A6P1CE61_RHITR|nr:MULTISPECIES: amino acid ABC transporter permease [Rhizobium]AGB73996.1 putative polar amino acid ABC transporter, permease protein [Rhizobium tropici CIAT 899]MBB4240480.1 His/Glu/Gln/Arg/opine family amino acid ABC transporter permease subunit [Rhizobium tropici]MBB5592104.1 His/Glu/Gln/Arg/opine family amino acid ABC transporter permease subunit [Rhizobium tropici]MBB6491159.1 His/Glu/Gln/Arg/opine family amino acid ABC transporter permease subunit [Rhizobium tropici]NEV15137.1 amino aci
MSFWQSPAQLFQVSWGDYAGNLGEGLLRTLAYTVASFVGAALLGLMLALMRLNRLRIVRLPATIYTEVFKNVPLLAIIFVTYFGLPSVGIRFSVFVAGVLSLVLFYAAYLSEIFRAAISGIHSSQNEAAHALGLGRATTFGHVVLPQALRLALPGTNTMFVDLLKSTSLLVTISAAELMTRAQLIASETFRSLEVYLVIAAIYFAVCYPVSQCLLLLERTIQAGIPLSLGRRRRLRLARALIQTGG